MRTLIINSGAWLSGALAALCIAVGAHAAPSVLIELNKLKPVDNACRVYVVTQNLTDKHFEKLRLDLIMFDKDGIVARRLAVGFGPLRPGTTNVKVFDIPKIQCEKLGQFLLNGALTCTKAKGPIANCESLLAVSSRSSVPFIQ